MKLEDQVAALDQAMRLKELGVEQISYFVWGEKAKVLTEGWGVEGIEDNFYAAFTVAELGIMLPAVIKECKLYQWPIPTETGKTTSYGMQYRYRAGDINYGTLPAKCIFGDTEAIARANLLIALLEDKTIMAEECNNRLTDK